MISFVKNFISSKSSPIGVDFGSDSLKMGQVAFTGGEWRLTAAASLDVPSHVRHDANARMEFLTSGIRDLMHQGGFNGRTAVLALPAASMFIQHLRMPKMDEEATRKALPWEARGKIPIDPSQALLRHHIAGEVYQDQEPKNEIILMAAGRELINQFLAAAARAKLDVVGMNVEPKAIVDCFTHLHRRKGEVELTSCYLDIGSSGSRAFVARSGHILFAKNIPIGGEHLTRAVATALSINIEEARLLRLRLSNIQTAEPSVGKAELAPVAAAAPQSAGEGFAILGAALAAAEKTAPAAKAPKPPAAPSAAGGDAQAEEARRVELAIQEPLSRIVEELDLCRRYYESTFPNKPVERLVFVGGEAKNKQLCQIVARELGLAAQIGDPLARMGRASNVNTEVGMDRRAAQPNWAVAIGLSMGPCKEAQTAAAA